MTITSTELKLNLKKYISLSMKEDIGISKNGKVIAMITNPNKDKYAILNSLVGILPDNINENEMKENRINDRCGSI